jgi:hypothetical protein
MIDFAAYFGTAASTASPQQLRNMAELVESAIESGGRIANAFDTCFVEHLHQIGAEKVLRPYRAEAQRARRRA